MERTCKEEQLESSSTGVFELLGEPAVVINGVPSASPGDFSIVPCETTNDAKSCRDTDFGEWLEGREVRKLFGKQFYTGVVTKFDKETGWYRVVYEDGDFEDLEWHELEEVLLSLDINVPLKTLALKMIKRSQKPVHGSGTNVTRSRKRRAKKNGGEGKAVEMLEEASSMVNNTIVQHFRTH
ncbi:dirigent protein 17-like isoform X2 [Malania oleifera]|uniref:dirigent protein 17-like isoform X2 n=1 Tax=Malania oleifera TaxID=397392 RepID=UPI0025ADDCEB|nr:dirigent protein 17-like isoform X2 [Malania oleifera]XP_057971827.1 dirigent protein 17-like isoform X2 [Malania oleifera]XP_057971829.1 dirigent protein 17-like isoform X2 [Malania oleifera]XP_057971830.1 dirigent protein 17-like isoform X2 [Malania oleifera]XP_057971831.1 dirigent protein 17-like isoform X2 [Malania oleifera]XP_057971832.1 dirigent protein 17-like isoform X2 [Malania oleifera]XP_057971833.1 dirigent protein 17-like isoform X2 [Malania oleifera]XP_057971834.1 dirigent p